MDHSWLEKKVVFVGLGPMGLPMATNLQKGGVRLTVWNRTLEKAAPLEEIGATVAESLPEALSGADAVFLSLANGPVVDALLFESNAIEKLPEGAVLIDTSSIPPHLARLHAERLRDRGVHHLDSPVSGGTVGAAEGSLAIMVGGDAAVFDRCRSLLQCMGKPVLVGGSGAGQYSKLCNQMIVGATVAAVAEAMMFAGAGGADPAAVREALLGGFADSRILREHGIRMIERNFAPGGASRNQLKDLKTAIDAGKGAGLTDLPMTAKACDLFQRLCDQPSGAELDHSAILTLLEGLNGIGTES